MGRTGVKVNQGITNGLPEEEHTADITGTVSSLRLDCVLALATRLSREKSAALIRSGLVQLEFSSCEEISKPVAQGDRLSVRGYGRFVVTSVDGFSKKGRIRITIQKNI